MIVWPGTITPRSMTSKLLHPSTTPTMFLPMSWTSPLTVAMITRPLLATPPTAARSASMNGSRWATARFITRALLTTCGRNILPGAEQVADGAHAGHQGPLDDVDRAPVGDACLFGVRLDEVDDAVDQRVLQARPRPAAHARPGPARAGPSRPLIVAAKASRRSVASGRRSKITSSTRSRSSGSSLS